MFHQLWQSSIFFQKYQVIWLIAVPAAYVPIIIVLPYTIRSSESRCCPIENKFSYLVFLNFEFQIVDRCSKKSILWVNFIEMFECSFGSMNIFQPLFSFFWGIDDVGIFYLGKFFISFSIITNFDWDTSLVAPTTRAGVSGSFWMLKNYVYLPLLPSSVLFF